jgi:Tfp pilus assembly protein PilN
MRTQKAARIFNKALAALAMSTAAIAATTGRVNAAGITLSGAQTDSNESMLMLSAVMAVSAIFVGATMGAVGGFILRRKPRE